MKTHIFYPTLICILLIFSCTTDDQIITDINNTSNLEVRVQGTTTDISPNSRTLDPSHELRLNMHWMSFITAESIMGSELARQDFTNNTLDQDVIALGDLIGPDASGDFKDTFYSNLEFIIGGIIEDMHCAANPMSCGAPEPPATSPPLPTGTGPGGSPITDSQIIPTVEEVISYLINYTLNVHCLEIFVPKTIPATGEIVEIAAMEHPLTGAQSHEAAIFTNEEDTTTTHRYIYYDIISLSYINSIVSVNNYVIITRPKRIRNVCGYTQYSRINFTNFFN